MFSNYLFSVCGLVYIYHTTALAYPLPFVNYIYIYSYISVICISYGFNSFLILEHLVFGFMYVVYRGIYIYSLTLLYIILYYYDIYLKAEIGWAVDFICGCHFCFIPTRSFIISL